MMRKLSMRDVSNTIVAYMHSGKTEAECAAWLETRGWSKPAAAHFVAGIWRQMSFARRQQAEQMQPRPAMGLWVAALAAVALAVITTIASRLG